MLWFSYLKRRWIIWNDTFAFRYVPKCISAISTLVLKNVIVWRQQSSNIFPVSPWAMNNLFCCHRQNNGCLLHLTLVVDDNLFNLNYFCWFSIRGVSKQYFSFSFLCIIILFMFDLIEIVCNFLCKYLVKFVSI